MGAGGERAAAERDRQEVEQGALTTGARPAIVPEKSPDAYVAPHGVEHIAIDKPLLEGLPIDNLCGRVIPQVKPAGRRAAVTARGCTVAIPVGVARRLLLHLVRQ